MILFYGEGRLGNQIFQYQALTQVARPGERILAIGLENLADTLELRGPKVSVLTRRWLLKRIFKYLINPLMLRPLARSLRLIGYVSETRDEDPLHPGPGGSLSRKSGLLRRLTFVDGGHYQDSTLWRDIFPSPQLRVTGRLRSAAARYLKSRSSLGRAAFVHVRRGDYLGFQTYGLSDLSLPVTYYRTAIKELECRIGRRHLAFVTDDPGWVEENFRDIPDKSIASFDPAMDFAIMAECGGGILSNSTFSLAAAFLLDAPEIVIAPRFWFGYRPGKWLPPRIEVEHEKLIYVPVLGDPPSP